MPNDYYSDAAAPPAEPTVPEPEPEGKEGESDSGTAVLPMSVLGGKEWKPGEEIVLQIVQMNEDGAVVKYASEKGGEEKATPVEAPAPGGGNPGPMSSMMY